MKTEIGIAPDKKRDFVRPILLKALPEVVAKGRVAALDEYPGGFLGFARQLLAITLQGFWQQAKRALRTSGKYANPAIAAVILFSFATTPAWPAPFVALLTIMLMFVIRDAYIEGRVPYRTAGILDAALVMIALQTDEALTIQWIPSLAMPHEVWFKASVACLPLLTMIRMLSRQMPEPDPNTLWPGLEPERIYWKLVRLNLAWIFMFYFSIMMFVADGPTYIDNLRGYLPGWMFVTWIMVQTNRLARRNSILQLNTDPRLQRLSRMVETLPQGMKRKDPLYWWYVVLECMIFFMASANIDVELWAWLQAEPAGGPTPFWRITTSLIAFVVSVVSWRYIKAANVAGVAEIRAAMDRMDV